MTSPPSLTARALVAAAMAVGFYGLALGTAAGCIVLAYHQVSLVLATGLGSCAFLILRGIVPRSGAFVAPGPRLIRSRQPRLFSSLEAVARAMGEVMPAEVYLIPEPNAWVHERAGVPRRRVMGLGLPLLPTLTVSQFKALLAHEFGHYHGGDTRLGPWIYRTREAIIRVVVGLRGSAPVQLPFRLYGLMFLRVTHAISRQQELAADLLAARTVGARPLMESLRRARASAEAYSSYWLSEVHPALQSGFLPPIAEGFGRFMEHGFVSDTLANSVAEGIAASRKGPYDTHPPLGERLAALERLHPGPQPRDEPLAISLIDGVADLEQRLLARLGDEAMARSLKRVEWDDVVQGIRLPGWRATAAERAEILAGWTVESVPERLHALDALGDRLSPWMRGAGRADRRDAVELTVGAALVTALDARGWTVQASPGGEVVCERSGERIEPFRDVHRMVTGELAATDWINQCRRAGLEGTELAPDAAVREQWIRSGDNRRLQPAASPVAQRAPQQRAVPLAIGALLLVAVVIDLRPWAARKEAPGETAQRGCDAGQAWECYNLGLLRAKGDGVPKDPAAAATLYKRACDGGEWMGCNNLGVMYLDGMGVEADERQSIALYERACRGGLATSCLNLAGVYRSCGSRPLDFKRAAEFLRLACKGGEQEGCDLLLSVEPAASRTPAVYRQMCDGGQGGRCADLAYLYECGTTDLPKDPGEALTLYKRSCTLGDSVGCEGVKRLSDR